MLYPPHHGNNPIEFFWENKPIPFIIVVGLFIPLWPFLGVLR